MSQHDRDRLRVKLAQFFPGEDQDLSSPRVKAGPPLPPKRGRRRPSLTGPPKTKRGGGAASPSRPPSPPPPAPFPAAAAAAAAAASPHSSSSTPGAAARWLTFTLRFPEAYRGARFDGWVLKRATLERTGERRVNFCGRLIGRGGETLRRLEAECPGVHIVVRGGPDAPLGTPPQPGDPGVHVVFSARTLDALERGVAAVMRELWPLNPRTHGFAPVRLRAGGEDTLAVELVGERGKRPGVGAGQAAGPEGAAAPGPSRQQQQRQEEQRQQQQQQRRQGGGSSNASGSGSGGSSSGGGGGGGGGKGGGGGGKGEGGGAKGPVSLLPPPPPPPHPRYAAAMASKPGAADAAFGSPPASAASCSSSEPSSAASVSSFAYASGSLPPFGDARPLSLAPAAAPALAPAAAPAAPAPAPAAPASPAGWHPLSSSASGSLARSTFSVASPAGPATARPPLPPPVLEPWQLLPPIGRPVARPPLPSPRALPPLLPQALPPPTTLQQQQQQQQQQQVSSSSGGEEDDGDHAALMSSLRDMLPTQFLAQRTA